MLVESFLYMFESDVSELKKGNKEAESSNKKLNKSLNQTEVITGKLGKKFKDLLGDIGATVTAYLAFNALLGSIKATSQYMDNLGKTSDLLGENVNQLQAWQEVIKKSGGDVGSFQGVLKKLNGDFNEFVTTGNTGILPFMQRLGIDMVDAEGKAKKVLDVLPELADQFQTMSKAESAGLGEKLGLSPATIVLLQQGRQEVEKQISSQKKLFSINRKQVKIFEDFNDSVDDTKTSFRALFVQLGEDTLPILQYFMEVLQDGIGFLNKHGDFITALFVAIGTSITAYALPAIIKMGIAMWTTMAPFMAIGTIIAGIGLAIAFLYDEITTFTSGGVSAFEDMLKWLSMTGKEIEELRELFKDLGNIIISVFKFVGNVIFGILKIFGIVGKGIFKAFELLLWFFSKGLVLAIEGTIKAIKKVSDFVKGIMKALGFGDDEEKNIDVNKNLNYNKMGSIHEMPPEVLAGIEAMNNANANPLNTTTSNMIQNQSSRSSSSKVSIGKVEVQTQATDADGISQAIGNSLSKEMKQTTASFEDGIEG